MSPVLTKEGLFAVATVLSNGEMKFNLYSTSVGHPDWEDINRRADKMVQEVSGVVEFDSGTLEEKAAEVRRVAGGLSTFARSLFTNHARLKKGDHTLLPPYFILTMLNKCNFSCTYCDNHAYKGYYDLPEIKDIGLEQSKEILRIIGKNVSAIYFCGGEPTLHKDLPELAEYAASINYFPIMINTNGSRFHDILKDPRYTSALKNLDIIIISLDALNLDKLSNVWGVKKALGEQVIVNILALRRLQEKVRFKLMVNTVITPETIDEADAILDWTNDLGIWYSPVPMNRGPHIHEDLKSNPDYHALCDKIIARKKQGYKILGSRRLIESLVKGKSIKCFPSLIPHVDGDGYTYWPCKTASAMEPIKLNVLDFESWDDLYQAAEKVMSVKDIHGKGPGQCGGDCQWMQNYVSDALARGVAHPIRSGALLEITEFIGAV
jgi:MoaA/NifB/PqqE/SkfB family radical SAM enzyme